jgi:hypothetical protein
MTNDLQQAIQLIKSGDKKTGGEILAKLVTLDPDNEGAWLWLSACVAPIEQKKYCLKQVLKINPNNKDASIQLAKLEGFQPVFESSSYSELEIDKSTEKKRIGRNVRKSKSTGIYFATGIGATLIVGICLASVWFILQNQGMLNLPTTINIPFTTSKPLSEFSYEDLQKSTLTPNDLTFSGLYIASEWKDCSSSPEEQKNFNPADIGSDVKFAIKDFNTVDCSFPIGAAAISEGIYLFKDIRDAQRFVEIRKFNKIDTVDWIWNGKYKITEISNDGFQFWIIRAEVEAESSDLIVQVDEAVITVHVIIMGEKLVIDDLLEIGIAAIKNIRLVQEQ